MSILKANRIENLTTTDGGINVDNSGRVLIGTTSAGSNGTADDLIVANDGSASDQAGITIRGGTSGRSQIFFSDGTSGDAEYQGMLRYDHSENSMQFRTAASERLRIDSSGNVGIGTTSPGSFNSDGRNLVVGTGSGGQGMSIYSGNSSYGTIYFADGTSGDALYQGAVLYNHASNFMRLDTAGAERMRIDSSGNVGIATTSPTTPLSVRSSSSITTYGNVSAQFSDNSTGTLYVQHSSGKVQLGSDAALAFGSGTSATERMRIDSSGRLLYGHSTSRTFFGIQTGVQIEGTQFEDSSLSITCNNASDTPLLMLCRSRGSSLGSQTALTDGQTIGEVSFVPSDGTNYGAASVRLQAVADDNHAENDVPGRFVIKTVPDGSESSTERFRLSHDGRLYVPGVWNFSTSGGTTVVVTSDNQIRKAASSLKYKTDIETLGDSYADRILDVRPVYYRSTCEGDNPSHSYWGFIAEEVAEIDPRLVSFKTIETTYDENGSAVQTACDPEPEGVAYDRFVPHLLNLIKRQKTRIEALETQNAAQQTQIDDLLSRVTALETAS